MNELHLFAGTGGGILGGILLGHSCVCAVEIEPYCRKVLLQRQRDGCLPKFPIWDDVRTFDGKPWRGKVDIVCGGFPCQDISAAGKGKGLSGERSGLWREMARITDEVRPSFVFVENSPLLVRRGLAVVVGDLAKMGYASRWGVVSAASAGMHHERERIWILAYSDEVRWKESKYDAKKWRHDKARQIWKTEEGIKGWPHSFDGTVPVDCLTDWTPAESGNFRGIDGMAEWVDRIESIGNGQVPQVVKLAWELL